jgi:hypothetical protein
MYNAMDMTLVRLNAAKIEKEKPQILLSQMAFKKIMHWTKYAAHKHNVETSGLGTILVRHGHLFVSDVWLIKPKHVRGAYVEQDPIAIQELMQKLYMGTGEPIFGKTDKVSFKGGSDPKNLRFLWHSHANFGVGWSGTDIETAMFDFCPDAKWTVNMVVNAKGHILSRMDFPKRNHAERAKLPAGARLADSSIADLPVHLLVPVDGAMSKRLTKTYRDAHPHFDAPPPPPKIDVSEFPAASTALAIREPEESDFELKS